MTSAEAVADRVFAALADPTRRRLLGLLAGGRPASATTLAADMPVSRQAVVQHLAVLQASELVISHRAGREVLFEVSPQPLVTAASWMTELAATWQQRLRLLKERAEG